MVLLLAKFFVIYVQPSIEFKLMLCRGRVPVNPRRSGDPAKRFAR